MPSPTFHSLGKTTEKIVTTKLQQCATSASTLGTSPSAFRLRSSTETALVALKAGQLVATGTGRIFMFTVLDIVAAFDPVDRELLLTHLYDTAGIDIPALQLLQSFLSSRTQRVVVGNCSSSPKALTFRVPQGSMLSLLLFNI